MAAGGSRLARRGHTLPAFPVRLGVAAPSPAEHAAAGTGTGAYVARGGGAHRTTAGGRGGRDRASRTGKRPIWCPPTRRIAKRPSFSAVAWNCRAIGIDTRRVRASTAGVADDRRNELGGTRWSAQWELTGRFHDFAGFLDRVGILPQVMRVTELVVRAGNPACPDGTVLAAGTAETFVIDHAGRPAQAPSPSRGATAVNNPERPSPPALTYDPGAVGIRSRRCGQRSRRQCRRNGRQDFPESQRANCRCAASSLRPALCWRFSNRRAGGAGWCGEANVCSMALSGRSGQTG